MQFLPEDMVREALLSHGVNLDAAAAGEPEDDPAPQASDGTFFDQTFLAMLPPHVRREALRAEEQRIRDRTASGAAAASAAAPAAGAL